MIYKNLELLSFSDKHKLMKEVDRCFAEFEIPKEKNLIDVFEVSRRLKSTNGHIKISSNKRTKEISTISIAIAYDVYKKFGFETFLGTVRHELAHYFAFLITKKLDHCKTFKEICVLLGGTMNRTHAGTEYSVAASADFISKKYEFMHEYHCPCGWKFGRVKRVSEKIRTSRSHCCPKCKTPLVKFKETKRKI
jgi:predicted SprT family Zn-dependent metalloprotease